MLLGLVTDKLINETDLRRAAGKCMTVVFTISTLLIVT